MAHRFSLSVRALVDAVLTKGSIDNRYTGRNRMKQGTEIHKKLQSNYSDADCSEVSVNTEIEIEDILLCVQGRIDGILGYETDPIVEEIKSTGLDADTLESPYEKHLAQAKIYAAIYAKDYELDTIKVRITYYSIPKKTTKSFSFEYTYAELVEYFRSLCEDYYIQLKYRIELFNKRDHSIEQLLFPFPYRANQRNAVKMIYHAMETKNNLFLNAPTGSGKTINALFPAIKQLKNRSDGTIFYLTAKSTQKQLAEDTLRLMKENSLCAKSVTITAKEKSCFLDQPSCNPDDCIYAKDYYDKLFENCREILECNDLLTYDVIRKFAQEKEICPFEFSLDLALWADIVICDYNYVFDPFAALKRFFDEQAEQKDHIVLVDEAHNLLDRSREMYSETISKDEVLRIKRSCKEQKQITKHLNKINRSMLDYRKSAADSNILHIKELDDLLVNTLYHFTFETDRYLAAKHIKDQSDTQLQDFYFSVVKFLIQWENKTEAHRIFYDAAADQLRLFCTDAKEQLQQCLSKTRSAIFFSATLTPLSYYCELLGGKMEDRLANLPSAFDPKHFSIMIDQKIKTTYAQRHHYFNSIAECILSVRTNVTGNLAVFFPSYQFMEDIYDVCTDLDTDFDVILQERNMKETERAKILDSFTEDSNQMIFAVSGGVFAEGVDLPGKRLSGCIVCGVSIPMICTERELIREHFEREGKDGFYYAYIIPGMNKVLQAMGRVIRTESDHGFALLLDERFLFSQYHSCFPSHYKNQIKIMNESVDLISEIDH